ncbi:MAG: xanthine dehydrogenase family protein molybdopterin-binding subunit, partial [Acidobacteriota bacterium]
MTGREWLSRREFIQVVPTAGAGLVLAVYTSCGAPEGTFAPGVWVAIDRSGSVTVTVAKTELGQGVRTSLPMILAEELEADWSKVRVEPAIADLKYGEMSTGGSTSIRTLWEPLRKAGAAAREMLISAAAERWSVPRNECAARDGAVAHGPSGRSLAFGELAGAAARLAVPQDAPLKDPKDFRIVGTRRKRLDVPSKIDGSAVFGTDVRVPGMLYAAVARCPVFGGRAGSFDAAKANAVSGVRKVFNTSDGVAVVAETTWGAFQGRDALQIAWDEGPSAGLSSESILKTLEALSAKAGAVAETAGKAVGQAARRLEAVYVAPYLAHATMEPMNCTAAVGEDGCEIWVPSQDPQGAQRAAARILRLPEEKVKVHTTLVGGGFGRRHETDFVSDAVEISREMGVPVKVCWTREDDMQHDYYRPVSLHRLSGAVDARGNLVAWTHRIVAPSISMQKMPETVKDGLDAGAVEGAVRMPYDIPNLRVEYVLADVPVPLGYWRSVCPSQNVFAVECFIDELAVLAKADPFEFRRRLMHKQPRNRAVLELAAERAGWGTPLPQGRFRGIAFSPPAFYVSPVAQVAEVSVKADNRIRVHRVVTAIDCGIAVNPDTIEAQMESCVVYALSAALKNEITIENGRVVQSSFDDHPVLTIDEMPQVEVHIVRSGEPPSGTG